MGWWYAADEIKKLDRSGSLKATAIGNVASRIYSTEQELKDAFAAGELGIGSRHYLDDVVPPINQYVVTPFGLCVKELTETVP